MHGTLFFSRSRYAAYRLATPAELAAGLKIGVADSAYHTSKLQATMNLYLPETSPEDGSNLQVCARLRCEHEHDLTAARARH